HHIALAYAVALAQDIANAGRSATRFAYGFDDSRLGCERDRRRILSDHARYAARRTPEDQRYATGPGYGVERPGLLARTPGKPSGTLESLKADDCVGKGMSKRR